MDVWEWTPLVTPSLVSEVDNLLSHFHSSIFASAVSSVMATTLGCSPATVGPS
jgi:hypothetical protein